MQLYTLVSLIIGIFGSTYAALNALRTNLEGKVKKAAETSHSRAKAFEDVCGTENPGTKHCKNHCKSIATWHLVWTWSHAIPAILFFVAIALLAPWVLWDWEKVTTQFDPQNIKAAWATFPWNWMRSSITTMFLADVSCLALAMLARSRCLDADTSLQELSDSAPRPALENPAS